MTIPTRLPSRGRLDDLTPPPHIVFEEFLFLRMHGEQPSMIAARLHLKPDSMLTMLRRHGVHIDTDVIGGWT